MSENIEPALSADHWRDKEYESPEVCSHAVVIRRDADGSVCVSEWFGGPETRGDVIELPPEAVAPAIALLNDALPDDDARKITREKIAALKRGIGRVDLHTAYEEENALRKQLWEFADALESYLPPETR